MSQPAPNFERDTPWKLYCDWFQKFAEQIPESKPTSWNISSAASLASLVLIWAFLFYWTWGTWGSMTIDNGREMYVPWELAQGKILYRDIWYPYTPGGPYLNSLLFRVFGPQLAVLYWAGSLAALGCAVLLLAIGRRLSSALAGWTAGTVLLAEAFFPGLFSFPLPYSYGSVYGVLTTCLFLWITVHGFEAAGSGWVLGAGLASAAALAFKPEFGAGCFVALAALLVLRAFQKKTFSRTVYDLLSIVPSILLSMAMAAWMVSLRGAEFITQENLMSWPSNYFMRAYGPMWLRYTGLGLDKWSVVKAASGVAVIFAYCGLRVVFRRFGLGWDTFLFGSAGVVALLCFRFAAGYPGHVVTRFLFFPPAMVLLLFLALPLLFAAAQRRAWAPPFATMIVLYIGAASVAIRTLVGTDTEGYSIYYNGPVVLAFLLLLDFLVFPQFSYHLRTIAPGRYPLFGGVIILACLPLAEASAARSKPAPLKTDRGTIYMSSAKAVRYAAAIDLMKKAAAAGNYAMSVPEDTGLYFLSGTHCPSRVYAFTPGLVVPGEMMREEIREISRAPVQYLIWSNRTFEEYGVKKFGTDFDQPLGQYFRSHFRPIQALVEGPTGDWSATIWERLPEGSRP